MSPEVRLRALRSKLAEIHHLAAAAALMAWDQETYMPTAGIAGRAAVLKTLSGLCHDLLVAPEVGDLLAGLAAAGDQLDAADQALVREVRRDRDRAVRVPGDLVRALAEARALAQPAWQRARRERCYAIFAPHLRTLLALRTEEAGALSDSSRPYDALLDEFEPGASQASLDPLFERLVDELTPLLRAVGASPVHLDTAPIRRCLPPEAQREFGLVVAAAMGFDLEAGRLDPAAHPFCTGIHSGDVRLTWRHQEDDLRPALFGIIHEAGHGLYEQGLPRDHAGTPLGEACSLGVHESQSRLWENLVARSLPFWTAFLPRLTRAYPGPFDGSAAGEIFRAVNEVRPSLIRVEADELTYNLHVALRYGLEKELLSGGLGIDDLPAAWNDRMEELLGLRPPHDGDGVLQDIHWSMGAFGYFPTYTLGNLYAAQLYDAALAEIGPAEEWLAKGELTVLTTWLRDRIHRHGRRYPPAELIRLATGNAPSPEPFLRYARAKFGALYAL